MDTSFSKYEKLLGKCARYQPYRYQDDPFVRETWEALDEDRRYRVIAWLEREVHIRREQDKARKRRQQADDRIQARNDDFLNQRAATGSMLVRFLLALGCSGQFEEYRDQGVWYAATWEARVDGGKRIKVCLGFEIPSLEEGLWNNGDCDRSGTLEVVFEDLWFRLEGERWSFDSHLPYDRAGKDAEGFPAEWFARFGQKCEACDSLGMDEDHSHEFDNGHDHDDLTTAELMDFFTDLITWLKATGRMK